MQSHLLPTQSVLHLVPSWCHDQFYGPSALNDPKIYVLFGHCLLDVGFCVSTNPTHVQHHLVWSVDFNVTPVKFHYSSATHCQQGSQNSRLSAWLCLSQIIRINIQMLQISRCFAVSRCFMVNCECSLRFLINRCSAAEI